MSMPESGFGKSPEENPPAPQTIVLSEDLFEPGSAWNVLFKKLKVDLPRRVRPSTIFDQSIRPVSAAGVRRPELPELAQRGLLTARQILATLFEEITALDKRGNVVNAIQHFMSRLAFTPHAILLFELGRFSSKLYPLHPSAEDEQRRAVEEAVRLSTQPAYRDDVFQTISLRYGFADGIARTAEEIGQIHPLPREKITGQISDVKRNLALGKIPAVRGYIALSPYSLTRLIWPNRVFWRDIPFQTRRFERVTLDDFNLSEATRNELSQKAPKLERLSVLVRHTFVGDPLSQSALNELRSVLTQLPYIKQPSIYIPDSDMDVGPDDDFDREDPESDDV